MFLNTLSVTLKQFRTIVEKKKLKNAGICKLVNRGKHHNHIKIYEKDKQIISFIMFPFFESHYSRSHSDRKYLNPDLSTSKSKMYRLYANYCHSIKTIAQSESTYRYIFVEEYTNFKNQTMIPATNVISMKCY